MKKMVAYSVSRRRRITIPVGHAGKSQPGYEAAGGGRTVDKDLYCGFCGKNGQGMVNQLTTGESEQVQQALLSRECP